MTFLQRFEAHNWIPAWRGNDGSDGPAAGAEGEGAGAISQPAWRRQPGTRSAGPCHLQAGCPVVRRNRLSRKDKAVPSPARWWPRTPTAWSPAARARASSRASCAMSTAASRRRLPALESMRSTCALTTAIGWAAGARPNVESTVESESRQFADERGVDPVPRWHQHGKEPLAMEHPHPLEAAVELIEHRLAGPMRPQFLALLRSRGVVVMRPTVHCRVDMRSRREPARQVIAGPGGDDGEHQRHLEPLRQFRQLSQRRGRFDGVVVAQPEFGGAAVAAPALELVDERPPQRRGVCRIIHGPLRPSAPAAARGARPADPWPGPAIGRCARIRGPPPPCAGVCPGRR